MFDLLDRPLVFIPVKWPGLAEGAGGEVVAVEHSLDIQVEIIDRPEFQDWMKGLVEDAKVVDVNEAVELSSFRKVAKDWRRIKFGGKKPDFSDENITKLLRWPGFLNAFGDAYMEAWAGKVAAREGNSAGSRANGPADEPIDATPKAATPTPAS